MARILVIGDSITNGMAPYLPRAFSRMVPTSVVVEAKDGASTRWWWKEGRIFDAVSRNRPTVVVLALGTNDVGEESNRASYELLWDHAITDAGSMGATVVPVGPFSGPGASERNRIIAGVNNLAVNGLVLADGLETVGAMDIHFTAAGYQVLAGRLGEAVYNVTSGLGAPRASTHGSPIGPIIAGLGVGGLILLALEVW